MKWKKYVKSVVVFLFTIAVIGLGIFLGIKLLKFFMPFVIGWLIALIANPLVRMLERRLKVARKHTSMFLIIGVIRIIKIICIAYTFHCFASFFSTWLIRNFLISSNTLSSSSWFWSSVFGKYILGSW